MSLMVAGLLLVLLVWVISSYNRLVQVKHEVSRALANIDVLLKQRHDELPKLVEVCRQVKQFEQDTLQRVIAARGLVQVASEGGNVRALGDAEQALRSSVGRLFAVAEAYPELKASDSFLALQSRITALEDGIADRREVYNAAVNINNMRLEQFPDNLLAGFGDFRALPLLKFGAAETADPDLRSLFA